MVRIRSRSQPRWTIQGPQGAEIHYTVDGQTPTSASQLYSEAFTLSETTIVKAKSG